MATKWMTLLASLLLLDPFSKSVSDAFVVPSTSRWRRPLLQILSRTQISPCGPTWLLRMEQQQQQQPTNHQDWNLTALIEALDEKGIRYLPTSTRRELEDLLGRHAATCEEYRNKTNQTIAAPAAPITSLQELLAELDRRNVRYKPNNNREELEAMLKLSCADTVTTDDTVSSVESTRKASADSTTFNNKRVGTQTQSKPQSLTSLLEELDSRGIRYPPCSTRAELEALLDKKGRIRETAPKAHIPMVKLMNELDRRRIRYPTDASRIDLEALLYNTEIMSPRSVQEAERRRSRRRHRRQQDHPTHRIGTLFSQSTIVRRAAETAKEFPRRISRLKPVTTAIPGRISQTVTRQVKRVGRKVNDMLVAEDEDGIREPIWYYSATDVVEISENREHHKNEQTRRNGPSGPERAREPTREQVKPISRKSRQSMYQLPTQSVVNVPFTGTHAYRQNTREPPRASSHQARNPRSTRRRIYSPYGEVKSPAFDDDGKDMIDRFGDFVADKAEEVLWGPDSTKGGDDQKQKGPKKSSKARYWKDRLAEQFDYALGLHDDGKYYNRWEVELKEGKQGTKQPGSKRWAKQSGNQRNNGDVPVWEEEGNLISLLFGRRPSGGQLSFERFMDQELSSKFLLVNFFRTFFKGILTFSSYTCRWASVKGALPQPIVVMGLVSAVLCARPRHRLSVLGLTLLALRTTGELLHGYVNNNWDDANYREYDDEENDVADGHNGNEESWEGDGL